MNYQIISVLNDVPGKFVAMVSFNGHPAERYEVESLDPNEISTVLEKVNADAVVLDNERAAAQAAAAAVQVIDGQIVP